MSDFKSKVSIRVHDDIGIISILDGKFNTLDSGFGQLNYELPAGIYKAICQVGNKTSHKFFSIKKNGQNKKINFDSISLDDDDMIFSEGINVVDWIKIPTIQPIEEITTTELLICFNKSDAILPLLSIWSACNKLILECSSFEESYESESLSFIKIKLSAGNYLIKYDYGTSHAVSRPVFLPINGYGALFLANSDLLITRSILLNSTLILSTSNLKYLPPYWFKLNGLMRDSLRKQKNLSAKHERIMMLNEKFENPMLGLYIACLLFFDKIINLKLLRTVLSNLTYYLGTDSADLIALKLAFNRHEPNKDKKFEISNAVTAPPLLSYSWKILIEEANKNPKIFADNSICWDIQDRIIDNEIWLTWLSIEVPPPSVDIKQNIGELVQTSFNAPLVHAIESFGLIPLEGLFSEFHSIKRLSEGKMFTRVIDTALPQINFLETTVRIDDEPKTSSSNKMSKKVDLGKTLGIFLKKLPWDEIIYLFEKLPKNSDIVLSPLQEKLLSIMAHLKDIDNREKEIPKDYWPKLRKSLVVTEPYIIDNIISLAAIAKNLLASSNKGNSNL
mgnify:CR=1 FL=1